MNILLPITIFILVLFLYIYVTNQFKKSEDLDIYETDYFDNKQLQEICEIRQPVLFNLYPVCPDFFHSLSNSTLSSLGSFDVKLKDLNDYYTSENTVDPVILSLQTSQKLMENDESAHFLSETNTDFLEESGIKKPFGLLDEFLKPHFTTYAKNDILLGSNGAITPLRYHTNYRQFLCVNAGKIRVKMTPWKSSKYLHPIKDYETYEFYSPVHPAIPQNQYIKDFERTKFLEFDVVQGYALFIPPYWWYSIQFLEGPSNIVSSIAYTTIMNVVSNIPDLSLYWLQQQNIRRKVPNKIKEEIAVETKDPILEPILEIAPLSEKVDADPPSEEN